jgi:hypothetical protein
MIMTLTHRRAVTVAAPRLRFRVTLVPGRFLRLSHSGSEAPSPSSSRPGLLLSESLPLRPPFKLARDSLRLPARRVVTVTASLQLQVLAFRVPTGPPTVTFRLTQCPSLRRVSGPGFQTGVAVLT